MTTVTPSWYDQFHCLAGACPDTCCQDWEVPVDPDTAALYRSLPGEMGEALRSVLVPDEEGEPCLQLRGGKCPMLEKDGLCRVYGPGRDFLLLGEIRTGRLTSGKTFFDP